MSSPYLSEIRIVSFNFAPKGWAFCNGQTMAIEQNAALFALLGTTYGGNGTTTFQLPNLQGCMAVNEGNGLVMGQSGGEVGVTLTEAEIPAHSHQAQGESSAATSGSPAGNAWADSVSNPYGNTANATMAAASVTSAGGGQPHNNMAPYLTLSFIIALQGVFPSRS